MPLSKGAIATWSVLIYWQVRDTLSSITQCQGATYSIQNRVLTGHAFRTKPCATMECCVKLCGEDLNCKSINYYRKTKTCELNNVSAVVSPESMVDFELSMYMTNAFSPCHLDFECEGQGRICQVMEDWSYCKGNIGILFLVSCYFDNGCEQQGKISQLVMHKSKYISKANIFSKISF